MSPYLRVFRRDGQGLPAALKTGALLDELAKGQRRHFDRDRKQLTIIGKRNKLRVIDLVDAGDDLGFDDQSVGVSSLPGVVFNRLASLTISSSDGLRFARSMPEM
jgi:hypothetical protein